MSSGAGGAGASGRRGGDETEVDSRPLVVERKRLYFNVRENSRGRFLKIAEVNRQKRSTVIIPQSGWVQMRDLLNEFIAAAEKANPGSSKAPPARAPKPAPAPAAPSTQLWVENLPWATTSEELRAVFEGYGDVLRCETLNNSNGRPRGVGVVKFAEQWQADEALANVPGTLVADRDLRVRYDRFPDAGNGAAAAAGSKIEEADDAEGMPLVVRTADGTELSLTVMPISTVGDVLAAIDAVEGLALPEGARTLTFNGRQLDASASLSDCGVTASGAAAELELGIEATA